VALFWIIVHFQHSTDLAFNKGYLVDFLVRDEVEVTETERKFTARVGAKLLAMSTTSKTYSSARWRESNQPQSLERASRESHMPGVGVGDNYIVTNFSNRFQTQLGSVYSNE
jgi:hypothetical protein